MNNFFKSESDRQLWIKLNAERIQFGSQTSFNEHEAHADGLGSIDEAYSPMHISRNQLVYDENNCNEPRLSLEELLSLTSKEAHRLIEERDRKYIMENFEDFQIQDFIL